MTASFRATLSLLLKSGLLTSGAFAVLAQTPTQTFAYSELYESNCQSGCPQSTSPNNLIQGSDGNFYVAALGGWFANDYGAVYKVTPSRSFSTLYNFCSGHGSACPDGVGPEALIQRSDGNFYGVTYSGGAVNSAVCNYERSLSCGTVFQLTPSGALTTLHTFCAKGGTCSDGYDPVSLVEGSDGNFYGTTQQGGCAGAGESCGTVFRITPSGTFTTLHQFCGQPNCADGAEPGELILGHDGNLYGVTFVSNSTGKNPGGVVYQLTPAGKYAVLYNFCSQVTLGVCQDGSQPSALAESPTGTFYGTTLSGGSTNNGTAFSLTSAGQASTLYSFCPMTTYSCPENPEPIDLIVGSDGNLYGLTATGSTFNGTLFQLTTSGNLAVIHGFCTTDQYCSDGVVPSSLIQASDGNFYGTTAEGGYSNNTQCPGFLNGCGAVFKLVATPPNMFLSSGTLANGATYVSGGLVPGSWAQVKGTALASTTRIWAASDFTGLGNSLPTNLSWVQVKVNNIAAAVYYISPGQISFQVPSGVSGSATVEVINNGITSNPLTAGASSSAPGIFPVEENGVNYPAGVFLDGHYVGDPAGNSAFRNAKPGDVIQLYATGLVATPAGVVTTPQTINGVTVTIGTTVIPADSVTLVAVGEFQINFTVPQSFASQPAGAYPISIQVAGVSSPGSINTFPAGPLMIPIQP